MKNKNLENSNKDSINNRSEVKNLNMLNQNNIGQISSNINIELPSLLQEEKHIKPKNYMNKFIEQNKENNKRKNKKEDNLNIKKIIKLSYYEFICILFCKKKKSEKFINFHNFADCLKSKSSIDAILKSVFGIDLLKKLIFKKEDREIIEKIEFFNQY